MDLEKAKSAYRLYSRRDDLRSSILTMRSRYDNSCSGTTNLTIPSSWLPAIIKLAEAELADVDEQIDKL